jgi:hypothetical protein
MWKRLNAYSILVGKPEGKRPLGPRRRWEGNIKTDLKTERMGWYGLGSSGSGQGRVESLVKTVMNFRDP